MESPTGGRPGLGVGATRVAALVSVVGWLAFAAAVVVRPRPLAYEPWLDVVLYNLPFVAAAAAAAHRWRSGGAERRAWVAMAIGLAAFAGGNCYGSIVLGDQEIYPSPADGLWLSFYAFAYAAIVLLGRSRSRPMTWAIWLDGAIAGTGAAALVAALALEPLLHVTDERFAEVVTNLAYPVADVLLVVVLVAVGYAVAARDLSWWLLGLGLAVLCLGDLVFLFQEASETYQEGSWVDITWPLAAALIAVAATRRSPDPAAGERTAADRGFLVPGAFTATSIGVLAFGGQAISGFVAMLAAATLVVAAARTALTVRQVSALAHSRVEARTDELTGLGNRRRLLEVLDARLLDGAPTTLLLIDLDRFKVVNDSLGHASGDRLLVALGERLVHELPPQVELARLGGDEFAAVVPTVDLDVARDLADRCRSALATPLVIEGIELSIDASIGIASAGPCTRPGRDDLLAGADVAMYRAKRDRTGVETYSGTEPAMSRHSLTLLADLRGALAAGTLDLHYQPRVDLRTDAVDGVEALVRWHHPTLGTLAPGEFLPLVVEAGLHAQLLEFVVARSARDLRRLRQHGTSIRMSLNVFPADLGGPGLLDALRRHVDGDGLGLDDITVEVTEEAFGATSASVTDAVAAARRLGARISIDDFGTGHASLSRLRELPVDELKLDRSFLTSVPTDRHATAIVDATIALAHALDLPLVAEGVETAAAMDWLRSAGCDVAQGYHIAAPMPFERLVAWLDAREREHRPRGAHRARHGVARGGLVGSPQRAPQGRCHTPWVDSAASPTIPCSRRSRRQWASGSRPRSRRRPRHRSRGGRTSSPASTR